MPDSSSRGLRYGGERREWDPPVPPLGAAQATARGRVGGSGQRPLLFPWGPEEICKEEVVESVE